jgi:cyclopropane fatty-acyl-phospholipid synthase-like methyltransferase
VLRACRRLLKPGGCIAYTTIVVAEDLSKSDHRRAARMGPRAVSSNRTMRVLMEAAGFKGIEVIDVTNDFITTAQSWFDEFAVRERELKPVFANEFDERQKGRQDMIAAAGEGLLQRLLVSATAPSG